MEFIFSADFFYRTNVYITTMVVYEWTDSGERTLDIMRQNTVKLGEISMGNYNALKKRIHYLQLPLAILSAANAYAVVDLGHYVPDNYVTIACCVVSATLAGYLSYDWYVDSHKRLESDYSFQKSCADFSREIKEVLSVPRYERKIDGDLFLLDKFKHYKELVAGNDLIAKFRGDFTLGKNSLCALEDDMEGFVTDHWNIIFRPTLRRFKKKNMELIECVKKGGQSVSDIVEPAAATVAATVAEKVRGEPWWRWFRVKKVEPKNDIESGVIDRGEEKEGEVAEEKEGERQVEDKPVNFDDVYTVKEIPLFKKEDSKKFHVAFTEQNI